MGSRANGAADGTTDQKGHEIGHLEVLATAVAMNLEGAKSEMVDEVVTNPVVAARMGALEPRHYLSAGLAAMPSDANGAPFNAACIDVAGNLIANMRANVAAGLFYWGVRVSNAVWGGWGVTAI